MRRTIRIGDKSGIPVLIDILGTPLPANAFPRGGHHRHAAGLLLNGVSDTSFYWKQAFDERRSRIVREDQFAVATRNFVYWWERAKDEIEFDVATQSWSID